MRAEFFAAVSTSNLSHHQNKRESTKKNVVNTCVAFSFLLKNKERNENDGSFIHKVSDGDEKKKECRS